MGLFSFGSKVKKETKPRRAEPDTMTSLALQQNLGAANLDYLLEAYAPRTWRDIGILLEGVAFLTGAVDPNTENQEKILSKLDDVASRLDEISHRLDALEQRTQDLPQRQR